MSGQATTSAATNTAIDNFDKPSLHDDAAALLASLTAAQRHERVVESVRDDVAAMLLLNPEVIDVERPLLRYGFDSMGREMLRESLQVLLGVELSSEVQLEQLSAQVVAGWALTRWFEARTGAQAPALRMH